MALLPAFSTGQGAKAAQVPIVKNNQTLVTRAVDAYNAQLPSMISRFESAHPDAEVFTYDTHTLFRTMTSSFPAADALTEKYGLQPLVNLQEVCDAYIRFDEQGKRLDYLGEDDFRDSRCEGSVGEYFWLDGLHPTWSVHKVLAGEIVAMLGGEVVEGRGAIGGTEGGGVGEGTDGTVDVTEDVVEGSVAGAVNTYYREGMVSGTGYRL